MISSKLILFFCFYLLLFLDNSLGQKTLVAQDGNKELFQRAIEFGQTYRGLLGELGSQWKQLLIQLVQANRKLGLGKVQLTRFNDPATDEVGLVIPDSYADKVEELVAIRAQDIGTTQQYIDELEILKNEIALTMIVEMDETEEKFKEKNVRRKVKEAKENGLTDTDIKEILFAEFIESGEGLSPIDGRDSIADRLLSSFLDGMVSILDGNYDDKVGLLQYGNVIGCLPFGNCVGEGGDNGGNNNGAGGGGGDPGGGGGNPGGVAPGGASGGGDQPPGGGGDRPPYYLPGDKIGDIDDQRPRRDHRIKDDINAFFEEFMKSLPVGLSEKPRPSPVDAKKNGDSSPGKPRAIFPEQVRAISPEQHLETWLFNLYGDGLGEEYSTDSSDEEYYTKRSDEEEAATDFKEDETVIQFGEEEAAAGPNEQKEFLDLEEKEKFEPYEPVRPYFFAEELDCANTRVNVGMDRRRAQVQAFENQIQTLQSRRAISYFWDRSIGEPDYDNLGNKERAWILNHRITNFENLLTRARQTNSDLHEYRINFQRNYYRARDNVYYYANRFGWDISNVPDDILTFYVPPPPLPEFQNDNETDDLRYLISREHLLGLISIGQRLQFAFNKLRTEIDQLMLKLENETALLGFYKVKRTP